MARTLRAKLDMHFATLEFDKLDVDACSAILHVLRRLQDAARLDDERGNERRGSDIKANYEYSFSNGEIFVPRLHPISLSEAQMEEMPQADSSHLSSDNVVFSAPCIGSGRLSHPWGWRK